MIRQMEFKMEREGLAKEGDILTVTEDKLPMSWYYTVEHAIAMSGNYGSRERLKTVDGKARGVVREVKETDRGYFLVLEFEE